MTDWLIDTSALARLGASPDIATWADRIGRGLVRISTVTRLEVGYSARLGPDLRAAAQRPPLASMPVEHETPPARVARWRCRRCLPTAVATGPHRSPSSSSQ